MFSLCIAIILNVVCANKITGLAESANLTNANVTFAHLNQDVKVKQISEDNEVLSIEEEDALLDGDDFNQGETFSDEEELFWREEEEIVLLMQGRNTDGEPMFVYLKLSINDLRLIRNAVANREDFSPFDYGEVIYWGNGSPSQELREEINQRYGLMQVPSVPPSDLSGEQ